MLAELFFVTRVGETTMDSTSIVPSVSERTRSQIRASFTEKAIPPYSIYGSGGKKVWHDKRHFRDCMSLLYALAVHVGPKKLVENLWGQAPHTQTH